MAAKWPVKGTWSILLCFWGPGAHAGGREDGHGSGLSEVRGLKCSVVMCDMGSFGSMH